MSNRWDNDKEMGFELEIWSGKTVYPRTFCDDDNIGPIGIYIDKSPTCKLLMTPTVVPLGSSIAWDVGQSRSATGTIELFDLSFGGPTDTGDISNGDFILGPKTGNVVYQSLGIWVAELVLTDLLNNASQPCKQDIEVVEATVSLKNGFVGTDGGGVFLVSPNGTTTPINNGLTGGHLNVRALKIHPQYGDVWGATADGIIYTSDNGQNWTVLNKIDLGDPLNTAGDNPAPVTADLDQRDIAFDPLNLDTVVAVRTTTTRAWLYISTDYGVTWVNSQINNGTLP